MSKRKGKDGEVLSKTVAIRVTPDAHDRLRWLAWRGGGDVSDIARGYVDKGLDQEDFTGYEPVARRSREKVND